MYLSGVRFRNEIESSSSFAESNNFSVKIVYNKSRGRGCCEEDERERERAKANIQSNFIEKWMCVHVEGTFRTKENQSQIAYTQNPKWEKKNKIK